MKKSKTKAGGLTKAAMAKIYYANEPEFKNKLLNNSNLIDVYNWYSSAKDKFQAKEYVLTYLMTKGANPGMISEVERIDPFELRTIGWNCRLMSRGYNIPQTIKDRMWSKIKSLVDKLPEVEILASQPTLSVRDHTKEKISHLIATVQEKIDEFFSSGETDFNVIEWLRTNDVKPLLATKIADKFIPYKSELQEAILGKDPDIKSAYSIWKKPLLQKVNEFISGIINACQGRTESLKAVRKIVNRTKRVKKIKPAVVLVANLRYLPEQNGIKSINPTTIVGASQLWAYNTKKRALTVYHAATEAGLTVHRTSIKNYDENKSITKHIRKPELVIPEIVNSGKIALRTAMDKIRSVPKKTGKLVTNEVLLLKVA